MSKRILAVVALAAVVLMLAAAPALAEGYNDPQQYTRDTGYMSGPHGGYTTTTNKCQDCHSTHYASGSFVLLRANTREQACDYCHVGGGGSGINIQMDNEYDATSAVATDTMGFGTGHTLGYSGNAPVDIEPAYSDAAGFACFDCHTPHGNSARVLEPFGIPGRPAGQGYMTEMYGASFMTTQMFRIQEMFKVKFDQGGGYYVIPEDFTQIPGTLVASSATPELITNTAVFPDPPSIMADMGAWMGAGAPPAPDMMAIATWAAGVSAPPDTDGYRPVSPAEMGALFGLFDPTLSTLMQNWMIYWGTDSDEGNINTKFWNMGNFQQTATDIFGNPTLGYGATEMPEVEVWIKPLFPQGRFLLQKNPDSADDTAYTDPLGRPVPDGLVAPAGTEANAANGNKQAIDWDWPLGPAATWGPFFYTDNDERFPLAFPWAPRGVGMENEFCTSCHDGAAGDSQQSATVWYPDQTDSSTGMYVTAYSHDSQSRGCARAQYLNPNDGNNFGPHCRNCHTGAGSCQACHDENGTNWLSFGKDAFAPFDPNTGVYDDPADLMYEGRSGYQASPNHKSYAAEVGYQCIDGGFSFPHRTLGANMLKDELYGVDFDGTPVGPGDVRMDQASVETAFGADYFDLSWEATSQIAGQPAHDLDSVCIDCHGDATYWNGEDPAYYADFWSGNPLGSETWHITGWELLLKGLP